MDVTGLFIALIAAVVLGGIVVSLLNSIFGNFFSSAISYAIHKFVKKEPLDRQTYKRFHKILTRDLPFYDEMIPRLQAVFIQRMTHILVDKNFTGREGLEMTEEIKVRIAATMTQLTFGLKHYSFPNIHQIVVMPDVFYNKLIDRHLRGGTSPNGTIFFSWKHFEHGYAIADDKINLGLHEIAHAWHLLLDEDRRENRKLAKYFEDWMALGNEERERLQRGEPSFFRAYAKTNEKEFFAVAVEHFFEAPLEFKAQLPKLYLHLTGLLNLDPTRPKSGYVLDKRAHQAMDDIPLERAPQSSKNKDWIGVSLLLGVFFGVPASLYFGFQTVVNWPVFLVGLLALGLAFFYRKLIPSKVMTWNDFGLFIISAWMPLATAVSLGLNMAFPFVLEERVLHVKSWKYENREYHLILKEGEFNSQSSVVTFKDYSIPYWVKRNANADFKVIFGIGIAGQRVVKSREFVLPSGDLEPPKQQEE